MGSYVEEACQVSINVTEGAGERLGSKEKKTQRYWTMQNEIAESGAAAKDSKKSNTRNIKRIIAHLIMLSDSKII